MIDTIRFYPVGCHFHQQWSEKWKQVRRSLTQQGDNVWNSRQFVESTSGLRVGGDAQRVKWIEVSLPRLLFGHNGRLISCPEQFAAALNRLKEEVASLASPINSNGGFGRIDLVWQFKGDPAKFFQAHQHCHHPLVHSVPHIYPGESVTWEGSDFRARLYNKGKQLKTDSNNVIRLEFQMRGNRLKQMFETNDEPLREISFERCYQVFRKLALGFTPVRIPKVSSKAHEIAIGLKEGWNVNGLNYFDFRMQGKTQTRIRDMRKQIASLRQDYWKIDWETLLPLNAMPPAIEVAPLKRTGKPKNPAVPVPAETGNRELTPDNDEDDGRLD